MLAFFKKHTSIFYCTYIEAENVIMITDNYIFLFLLIFAIIFQRKPKFIWRLNKIVVTTRVKSTAFSY